MLTVRRAIRHMSVRAGCHPPVHAVSYGTVRALCHYNQRGVLRQAGAVYQFRHIELQHRLANRDADTQHALISRTCRSR
jgi:hypothetical protein